MESEYYLLLSRSGDVHGMIRIIRSYKEENRVLPSFAANALHVACLYRELEAVKTLVEEFRYSLTQCNQLHRDEIMRYEDSYRLRRLYYVKNTPLHCLLSIKSKDSFLLLHNVTHPVHDVVRYLVERDPTVVEISNSEHELPLHVATKNRVPLEVLKLVSSVNVNAQTASGDTALHLACEYDVSELPSEIIRFLIVEKECDTSIVNKEGNLPLHVAIRHKQPFLEDIDIVAKLCNCDVNTQNNAGDTLLHLACQHRYHDIIRFLTIEQKCDTSITNNEGNLPLHVAISKQLSLDIVKLLSECSIVNTQNKNGDTPLHLACKSGYAKNIIEFLTVDQRCDTSVMNHVGNLPVHDAISLQKPFLEDIDILAKLCNCDVNTQNNAGDTLLHLACQLGNQLVIKFLTRVQSCNTFVSNNEGNLPLHFAISKQFPLDIVKLLCRGRHILNSKNRIGDTPLHLACKSGNGEDVIQYLIKYKGCNPSISNNQGNLPIHVAIMNGSLHKWSLMTVQLLCKSSDMNVQNENGDTPLHLACQRGCGKGIVECFTENQKCDVSITNHEGSTPLHIAVDNKLSLEIVKLVSHHKCNVLRNEEGKTPIFIAFQKEQLSVISYLLTFDHSYAAISDSSGNLPASSHRNRPLHTACMLANVELAKYLVETMGLTSQLTNYNRELPLHLACAHDSVALVKLVSNCKVNSKTRPKGTPLQIALQNRAPNVVRYLIEKKRCDIILRNFDLDNSDVLHVACMANVMKLVEYIIQQRPALLSTCNSEGRLPIHTACAESSLEIVKVVSGVQQVNSKETKTGDTPLHIACRRGNLQNLSFLLKEKDCSVTIKNNYGQLPYHCACLQPSVAVAKMVMTDGITSDDSGDTPLHIACRSGALEIVQFLVSLKKYLSAVNKQGELPLHCACYQSSPEILKLVMTDINLVSTKGETALHIAIRSKAFGIVDFLVKDTQCDLAVATEHGELPLHYACRYAPLETVRFISDHSLCSLNSSTCRGDTPLHIACQRGSLDIVQYLVDDLRCYTGLVNEDCLAPVHIAMKQGNTEIAKYLIEEKLCKLLIGDCQEALSLISKQLSVLYGICVNPTEQAMQVQCGDTLLHLACRFNKHDLVKRLLQANSNAVLLSNSAGELPIHIACQQHNAGLVKLVAEHACVNTKTALGNTPLHECCRTSTSETLDEDCEIASLLVQETDFDPDIQNDDGLTPLHLAVKLGNMEIIQLLISRSNPNIADNNGQTPIMYAPLDKPQVLKVLLQHGADPSRVYELHKEYFRANSSENPPETPLKILVTGNASTGKTTVIESLKCEAGNRPQPAKPQTAGIIPSKFNSEIYGLVTWYDFAGQPEYYASNEAILQQVMSASPPVVLLLVDISQSEKDIEEKTLYWLTFIEHQCKLDREKPLLVIVGSHADKLRELNQDPLVKMEDVMKRAKCRLHTSKLEFVCSVVMDCRLPDSPEISELQKVLKTCSEKLQSVVTLNFTSHCFYVFLLDKFKSRPAVTIDEVVNCCEALTQYGMDPWSQDQASIENSTPYESTSTQWPNQSSESDDEYSDNDEPLYESESESDDSQSLYEENEELELSEQVKVKQANPISLLPTRPSEIVTLCEELNKRDHLILLRDSLTALKSWLILDKEFLLSEVNGTVFAPKNFTQHRNLASSTGVVAFDKFKEHFPEHDPNMLVKFLSHLEFCREIEDAKVLDLLQQESTSSSSRYFFFPGLIQIEKPEGVWKHDAQSKHYYSSGWVLECSKSGDFFTPRFIQVLLLRLVFTFALALPQRRQRGIEHPAVKRQCSVWKNGLSWLNSDGIETVVVMAEQSQAVHVMMRSQCDTPKKIAGLRSSVIKKVLDTAQDFNNHSTTEYLTDPNDLQCPPKSCEDSVLFSLTAVAEAVLQKPHCLISDGLKCHHQIAVKELLHSEPFAELSTDVLKKLFDNQVMGEVIPADFQYKLMASVQENADKTLICRIFDCQTPSQLQSTLRKRRLTYGQLKEELGRHSVFCRRNIVVRSCREFKHHLITINNNIKVV